MEALVKDENEEPSWRAFGIYGWPEAQSRYKI